MARLNLSHGSHAEHQARLQQIRQISQELDANVAVMLDTKGVEVRTGRISDGGVQLVDDASFSLFADDRVGDANGVGLSYPELAEEVSPGAAVLIDDGIIELHVIEARGGEIRCRVVRGGWLGDRKGVNAPGIRQSMSVMSEGNRNDLRFAIENDIVYLQKFLCTLVQWLLLHIGLEVLG